MGDVIYAMRNHGMKIDIVPDGEFEARVNEYASNNKESDAVSGLIAYLSRDENDIYTVDYSNTFTTNVLYRLGFKWPITDDEYMEKAIMDLDTMGFFDSDYFNKKR